MLNIGERAPDFTLSDALGTKHSLHAHRGRKVVAYFYPKDDTPGCVKEACSFRDHCLEFDSAGIKVFGISPDLPHSHRLFSAKYGLQFTLLCDKGGKVARAYNSWGVKTTADGRTSQGVVRNTFVIDEYGRIEKVFPQVNPSEHAREVLNAMA